MPPEPARKPNAEDVQPQDENHPENDKNKPEQVSKYLWNDEVEWPPMLV